MILRPTGNRLSQSGVNFVHRSLEANDIPVLLLDADMVNAASWDHDRMVATVERFLDEAGLT